MTVVAPVAYAQTGVTTAARGETHPGTQVLSSAGHGGALGVTTGPLTIDGYSTAHASTLFSDVWKTSESFTARAEAGLSRFETGHLAGYGDIYTRVRLASSSVALLSWQTDASGGVYRGHRSSEYLTGAFRLENVGAGNRLWLATGFGGAYDASSYGTANVTLGAAAQQKDVIATGAVNLVHARSTYDEVTGRLAWAPDEGVFPVRIHVEISGGARSGNTLGAHTRWAAISGTARLTGTSALVLAHGTAPSDPERATPGLAYTSVGLRLTFGGAAARVGAPTTSQIAPSERVADVMLSEVLVDGTRTLTIRAPARAQVEIMADFTSWSAVPMVRTGADAWTVRVLVRSGIHRLNMRMDGGEWGPIPVLPTAADGFGGSASLLVVH